jgi:hypothetical protein
MTIHFKDDDDDGGDDGDAGEIFIALPYTGVIIWTEQKFVYSLKLASN